MMQLNFRISKELVAALDQHVDGLIIRSRGQVLNIALAEWLARRAIPDHSGNQGAVEDVAVKKIKREQWAKDYVRVLRNDPMNPEEADSIKKSMVRAAGTNDIKGQDDLEMLMKTMFIDLKSEIDELREELGVIKRKKNDKSR